MEDVILLEEIILNLESIKIEIGKLHDVAFLIGASVILVILFTFFLRRSKIL